MLFFSTIKTIKLNIIFDYIPTNKRFKILKTEEIAKAVYLGFLSFSLKRHTITSLDSLWRGKSITGGSIAIQQKINYLWTVKKFRDKQF